MPRRLLPILVLPALAAALALFAGAWGSNPERLAARLGDTMPGPFAAEVIEVVDGDTLDVRVMIWLGQEVITRVRLNGIDTPELRGACEEEKRKAAAARDLLVRLVAGGTVTLRDVRYDKYGGRVLAVVSTADGQALTDQLIAAGLARPYDGKARAGWCG